MKNKKIIDKHVYDNIILPLSNLMIIITKSIYRYIKNTEELELALSEGNFLKMYQIISLLGEDDFCNEKIGKSIKKQFMDIYHIYRDYSRSLH